MNNGGIQFTVFFLLSYSILHVERPVRLQYFFLCLASVWASDSACTY